MELNKLELARLNQSLAGKLRNEAQRRKVPADLVRKQYVFTLFLSRIFDVEPQPPWVLLGGNALMIRTGGGRFTTDIDLAKEEIGRSQSSFEMNFRRWSTCVPTATLSPSLSRQ